MNTRLPSIAAPNLTRKRRAAIRAALGCAVLLATIAYPAQAAVYQAWALRYNGLANGNDRASTVAVDGSGNVVVTGGSRNASNGDYYTAKYSANGTLLVWEKRYNGPANGDDDSSAVVLDGSGNVLVTGYSYGSTATSGADYYTAKYAAFDGTLLWEKRYNGPANGTDIAYAMAVDGSGNVVVTGESWGGTDYDYYTAKYAAFDGALLWEKRYNGPANDGDHAFAVAVDGSGNVVVTGYSDNPTRFFPQGRDEMKSRPPLHHCAHGRSENKPPCRVREVRSVPTVSLSAESKSL